VLILCTGNVCRSPMAEGLLRRRLADAGIDARVSSAGSWRADCAASPEAVEVLARRGIDIAPHRSRLLARELMEDVDLVLAMQRRHLREAVALDPATMPIAFTLKELVRRGEAVGPRGEASLEEWLARAADGRRAGDLLGENEADDVADPIGLGLAQYEATASELEDLIDRLVHLRWGPVRQEAGQA
jgi:protein-tyrosine phosphatase